MTTNPPDHLKQVSQPATGLTQQAPLPNRDAAQDLVDGEQEYFDVEKIVRHKWVPENFRWEYLVRWKNYEPKDDTWEPKENIEHTDAYTAFINKVPREKRSRRSTMATKSTPGLVTIQSSDQAKKKITKRSHKKVCLSDSNPPLISSKIVASRVESLRKRHQGLNLVPNDACPSNVTSTCPSNASTSAAPRAQPLSEPSLLSKAGPVHSQEHVTSHPPSLPTFTTINDTTLSRTHPMRERYPVRSPESNFNGLKESVVAPTLSAPSFSAAATSLEAKLILENKSGLVSKAGSNDNTRVASNLSQLRAATGATNTSLFRQTRHEQHLGLSSNQFNVSSTSGTSSGPSYSKFEPRPVPEAGSNRFACVTRTSTNPSITTATITTLSKSQLPHGQHTGLRRDESEESVTAGTSSRTSFLPTTTMSSTEALQEQCSGPKIKSNFEYVPKQGKQLGSPQLANKTSSLSIQEELRDMLMPALKFDIDLLSTCLQVIGLDVTLLGDLKGYDVVIWNPRPDVNSSPEPHACDFETLALWYVLVVSGGRRVVFGPPEIQAWYPSSNCLPVGKASAVHYLFIHCSLLDEIPRLKGLVDLVGQPHFVKIYVYGKTSGLAGPSPTLIQPIMSSNSVLIPTSQSILSHITSTNNPFQQFRTIQKHNNSAQMFIHPITVHLLAETHQIFEQAKDKFSKHQLQAIRWAFKDMDQRSVAIEQEELEVADFALLDGNEEEGGEESGVSWGQRDEVEGIVGVLNEIRQVLYQTVRRFVMVVVDKSELSCLDPDTMDLSNIEVMTIGEATAWLGDTEGHV